MASNLNEELVEYSQMLQEKNLLPKNVNINELINDFFSQK